MRTFLVTVASLVVLAGAASTFASSNNVDPLLVPFVQGRAAFHIAPVVVLVVPRMEGLAPAPRYHRRKMVRYLRAISRQSIQAVQRYLREQGALKDESIRCHRFHWINASMACNVTPEGLRTLSQAPGIVKIYANQRVKLDPIRRSGAFRGYGFQEITPQGSTLPYDLIDMQWDKLAAEYPKLNGQGVVIGQVDTGVDGKHPALSEKVAIFFDVNKRQKREPTDSDSHGTHTAGTMIGTGRDGLPMGIAPNAKLISTGPLDSYDGMLTGMEFMLDPDGNAATNDFPRAVNNSWNCGGAPDTELFYRAISAWEAAGILPVFSAGNAGPRPGTITAPHEHPLAFAVAATGKDGKIADFSSRGPGMYHGQQTKKPDISAPGENILSSVPNGGYEAMSGTSMATPHVTGAAAILFQIDPNLTPTQVRNILIQTATPIGKPGDWDAAYGYGKINIYAAAKMAMTVALKATMKATMTRGEYAFGVIDALKSPMDLLAESIVDSRAEPVEMVFDYPSELNGDWIPLQ